MTRLKPDDVLNIPYQLEAYDEELRAKTGHNLRQIACYALDLKQEDIREVMGGLLIGVVPIGWGQGVIEGFCEATAAILRHLGFKTLVTGHSDISGLAQAYEAKADVLFLSDDDNFVALNSRTLQTVHNADATGRGFAAGLDLMIGGLAAREVLVLGCGAVGRKAATTLLGYGATVSIYDINSRYCMEFKNSIYGPDSNRLTIKSDFHQALAGHSVIVDATNTAGIIRAKDITSQTIVAAPGMPLGLSRQALDGISDRLLHDPLQIGVATMGMAVVKQLMDAR
jgi:pyrrolysine biosynthesis protein PylD